ncbi:MAG TPA: hypothetical protein V6D05_04030, partial [Stenomitos sp.]
MRLNPFHALAVAVLVAAGCTTPPGLLVKPAGQVMAQGASLHLTLDLGRKTQALVSDVTSLSVGIELPNREPDVRTFTPTDLQRDTVDFSGLPGGDAVVRVKLFDSNSNQIGEGSTLVPLLIGRRTLAQVYIGLSSEGRSDWLPLGPMMSGTYSIDPTPDPNQTPDPGQTPQPGDPTPPPPGQFVPRDYFAPAPGVTGRTYDVSEASTDDLGQHTRTAVFHENVMPGNGGPLVVRAEDWTYPDNHTEHRDATDSFRILMDGAVGWDTVRTEFQGISTSSFFVPNQAMTPEGALMPPDGKMWLEATDQLLETPNKTYTCLTIHEHRGPVDGGMDAVYWVAPEVGIVQVMRTFSGMTPTGSPVTG